MALTTFITAFGRYCFEKGACWNLIRSRSFPDQMKETLEGLDGCEAIMDDTIVYRKTEEEHDRRLNAILTRIEES